MTQCVNLTFRIIPYHIGSVLFVVVQIVLLPRYYMKRLMMIFLWQTSNIIYSMNLEVAQSRCDIYLSYIPRNGRWWCNDIFHKRKVIVWVNNNFKIYYYNYEPLINKLDFHLPYLNILRKNNYWKTRHIVFENIQLL